MVNKRTKPLRRTPLKRVSTKRAAEMKIYSERRKIFLQNHPFCQVWLKDNGYLEEAVLSAFHELGDRAVVVNEIWAGKERTLIRVGYIPVATEVHHREGRGKNYLNEATWLAVSAQAHRKIHQNPKWARANSFLV